MANENVRAGGETPPLLIRPKPLFSWNNLFFPLLLLALALAIAVGFFIAPHAQETPGPDGRNYFYTQRGFHDGIGKKDGYITGVFPENGWDDARENGYLIRLLHPETGEFISEHLLVTNQFFLEDRLPTKILVEDLDISGPEKSPFAVVSYTPEDFTKEQLESLVRPGDAVTVEVLEDGSGKLVVDDQGVPVVDYLTIRRFGGWERLVQEVDFLP